MEIISSAVCFYKLMFSVHAATGQISSLMLTCKTLHAPLRLPLGRVRTDTWKQNDSVIARLEMSERTFRGHLSESNFLKATLARLTEVNKLNKERGFSYSLGH